MNVHCQDHETTSPHEDAHEVEEPAGTFLTAMKAIGLAPGACDGTDGGIPARAGPP